MLRFRWSACSVLGGRHAPFWVVAMLRFMHPGLPGCISQGKTREEAIENIREAIQLYIEVLKDKEQPVPAEKFETVLVAV